jgi:hypothetical protein
MKYTTHNITDIDPTGTHLQGYIEASYDTLVDLFGEPLPGDGYKVDAEWFIQFEDGTLATVYNYKDGVNYCGEGGIPVKLITEWHIGGDDHNAKLYVVNLVNSQKGVTTTKTKTSELTGAQLDWAVAKCEDVPNVCIVKKRGKICVYGQLQGVDIPYQPSLDWGQGGPIIEREDIDTYCLMSLRHNNAGGSWGSDITGSQARGKGATALISAMRCYVASKLGEEIDLPEDLV